MGTQIDDTSAGLKIGASASELVGFYGTTPIAQRSGSAQALIATLATINNVNGVIASLTISETYTATEVQALRDACETLADDVRTIGSQQSSIRTLVNEMRTALTNLGLIKGSA